MYNRLRVLREQGGFSRAELAVRIGVNVQTVGALERGEYYPSLYVAMLISETVGLPVQEIFRWSPWDGVALPEGERL